MRNNLPLSLAAWATAALTALSFAACAKAVNGDLYDMPDSGTGSGGDSGASTQPSDDDSGGGTVGSSNGGNNNNGGEDSGTPSSGDDAGGTPSNGDDAGGQTPQDSGGSSSGGQDSAPPVTTTVCPDTTKYQNEYGNLNPFTLTLCTTNSDCSASDCCYAGTAVISLIGAACVKN